MSSIKINKFSTLYSIIRSYRNSISFFNGTFINIITNRRHYLARRSYVEERTVISEIEICVSSRWCSKLLTRYTYVCVSRLSQSPTSNSFSNTECYAAIITTYLSLDTHHYILYLAILST